MQNCKERFDKNIRLSLRGESENNLISCGGGKHVLVENSLRRNKATYLRNTLPQAPLDCVKAMGSPIVLTLYSSSVSRANELIWVGCVESHLVGPKPPKPG